MNGHRQLRMWRVAGELIHGVYRVSKRVHGEERFIAVPQYKRAAWSVQNNIAEGNAKRGRAERRRFFDVSLGSLAEVDSMTATLAELYPIPREETDYIEERRRHLTAGLFHLITCGR